MRMVRTAVAALTVALALPAAAQAHTVTPNVDCSAATLVYESTAGTTLSYEVVVNGVAAVDDSFVIPSSPTSGTLTVPYNAPAGPFPPAASPPTPPVNVATPGPPPASAVAGEQASQPASARLAAQSSCRSRVVRVTVAGRRIRTIAFSVNGRHVRTVTVRAGQRSVKVALPMRNGRASQVVRARVRFRNGARPRTLSARTARCGQAAVQPTFTG